MIEVFKEWFPIVMGVFGIVLCIIVLFGLSKLIGKDLKRVETEEEENKDGE